MKHNIKINENLCDPWFYWIYDGFDGRDVFENWWRRRELNPRPQILRQRMLHV